MIQDALRQRAPGQTPWTSPRKESDRAEILSGIYEGNSTGAPISIIIWNKDADSTKYHPIRGHLRPGHANFTYLEKYGIFDDRGGGRASARETACRVAGGAIAQQLIQHFGIQTTAYLKQVADIEASVPSSLTELQAACQKDPLFCPDPEASRAIQSAVLEAIDLGDSLGGCVEFRAEAVPVGLGDPIYHKLEARLAAAMLSIPASKAFSIGSGHSAVEMRGSEHNDLFYLDADGIKTRSNHAGGTLGGISTGMPLIGQVSFKPTSSIRKAQNSLDQSGSPIRFELPAGSRHDPCLALRAPAVVEAMLALVLADALLMNRGAQL
jgi:chorismate synthase